MIFGALNTRPASTLAIVDIVKSFMFLNHKKSIEEVTKKASPLWDQPSLFSSLG
jgi:hypothetical protein